MKKIFLFFIFFFQISIFAQTGANITGLVKINNIQQSNTNRILLTDGSGNLGQTTFTNLANVGTVVTTTLNTAVVKTQIAQNAKFLNLPNADYNRVVTIDSNGSLGYRIFPSLSNSSTNLTGTLGLNATNLINLTSNILNSPSNYTYLVVVDANGVLGKRPLINPQDVDKPCTAWVTTSVGNWGNAYGINLCFSDRSLSQERTCYYINGDSFTETQSITETRSDYCNPDPGVPCYWTTTSYGPWICDPADVNNKRRIKNESYICTNYNGTTYVSQTQSVNYDTSIGGNQAPIANFTWSANYRTISFDASSSYDPDGSIVSYKWEYGDVSQQTFNAPINTTSHLYGNSNPAAPAVYTVKLTVTDNCGRESSKEYIVTTSWIQKFMAIKGETYFQRAEGYYGSGFPDGIAGLSGYFSGQSAIFNITTDLVNYSTWLNDNKAWVLTNSSFKYDIAGVANDVLIAYVNNKEGSPSQTSYGQSYYTLNWTIPYEIINTSINPYIYTEMTTVSNGAPTGYITVKNNADDSWMCNETDPMPKGFSNINQVKITAYAPMGSGIAWAEGKIFYQLYLYIKYY